MQFYDCDVELQKMDAQTLNFDDESFDVVVSRNLTWTLPDVMKAYKEWRRVIKNGGMLLNFDSDCGEVSFTKKNDESDVHANISQELIAECNSIKDNLRISTHRRPSWDVEYLTGLGFAVQCDFDVAKRVHQDKNMRYDDVPLFGIYATKHSL